MKSFYITLLAVFASLTTGDLMAVEEAKYTVSLKNETLEIRQYETAIIAEVIVNDSFEDASNVAFRKLFNYISGSNSSRSKMAMTAPVTQEPQEEPKLLFSVLENPTVPSYYLVASSALYPLRQGRRPPMS